MDSNTDSIWSPWSLKTLGSRYQSLGRILLVVQHAECHCRAPDLASMGRWQFNVAMAQGSGSHQCEGLGLCAQSRGRPWNSTTAAGRDRCEEVTVEVIKIWEHMGIVNCGISSRGWGIIVGSHFFSVSHLLFNLLSL